MCCAVNFTMRLGVGSPRISVIEVSLDIAIVIIVRPHRNHGPRRDETEKMNVTTER